MENSQDTGSPMELAPEAILVQEVASIDVTKDCAARCNACHYEQIRCEEPQCPK